MPLTEDADRGSGRTTQQMLAAPRNAVFVWCYQGSLPYARELARKHGREDLTVVSPLRFETDYFRGREISGLVLDHATRLNDRQRRGYEDALTRIRPQTT